MEFFTWDRLIKGVTGGGGVSRMVVGNGMQNPRPKSYTEVVIAVTWGRAVTLTIERTQKHF